MSNGSALRLGVQSKLRDLALEVLEVLGLGDLGHLPGGPHLVDLDAQLPHLLLQTPLARPYFGRHPLGDACQLPQGVVPTGDAVQLSAFEASRLDGCRRRDDLAHLLQIFLLEVVEAFPGKPRIDSGPKAGVPQLVGT
jgi:hypothetical protein